MPESQEIEIPIEGQGRVSGLLLRPAKPRWLLLLAHGAGAGMRHSFMESLANELADVDIATLRYQFPYMEQRRRVPDSPAILVATVAAARITASQTAPDLALLAGGKSLGGRMTSHAAAQGLLEGVRGLVFFGFPLHPPNAPGTKRARSARSSRIPPDHSPSARTSPTSSTSSRRTALWTR